MAILISLNILTKKNSQKFGDVLGIMVLDLLLPKHGIHKDTARYVLSYSKPFELLSKEPACRWIHLQSRVSEPTYR